MYVRVSSPSQKKGLALQKEALREYCQTRGIMVDQWVEDIGSALNYKRKGFNYVIEQIELGHVKRLVIGYQDRLVRFGYEWFEAFCQRHGTEILVMNGESFSPDEWGVLLPIHLGRRTPQKKNWSETCLPL